MEPPPVVPHDEHVAVGGEVFAQYLDELGQVRGVGQMGEPLPKLLSRRSKARRSAPVDLVCRSWRPHCFSGFCSRRSTMTFTLSEILAFTISVRVRGRHARTGLEVRTTQIHHDRDGITSVAEGVKNFPRVARRDGRGGGSRRYCRGPGAWQWDAALLSVPWWGTRRRAGPAEGRCRR